MADHVRALDEALRQIVCYQHKDRVRRDSLALIQTSSDLRPDAASYVHNDGTESFLLRFSGTVPITYGGSTYHIPVTLWIVEQYPFRPPLVFVTPTAGMVVEANHRHVTRDGSVYLPYLNKWDPRNSSLDVLATILSSVFSELPPVRAKPSGVAADAETAAVHRPAERPAANPSAAAAATAGPAAASARMGATPADARGALVRDATARVQAELDVRLREVLAGMDKAWDQQRALEQRARAREEAEVALEGLERQMEEALSRARESSVVLQSWLEHHDGAEAEVDPDQVLVPTDAQSEQLLELVPRIAATDDAYFHLEHALANGHVGLDDMLRSGRRLARRQFMDKALVAEILPTLKGGGSKARAPPPRYAH